MRAAILAGGKGTRIAEYYPDLPKPMIPLCGKPLLQWQVEMLTAQGFADITLIVGHKADVIKEHFGDGSALGARIGYIVEDEPLGTGGALALLPREDTLVFFGDVYFDIDIARFVRFHYEKRAKITLFAHPNSHPHDSDIIVANDSGTLQAWHSKRNAGRGDLRNLVNAGLYVFSKNALPEGEAIKRDLEQDIIIPMMPAGAVYAYRSSEYVKDMGAPERLTAVEDDVKSGAAAARNLKNKQRAVFLDRDGTINEENGFISKPEQIKLIPGVPEAIAALNKSPFLAICVTNQPVIARGAASFEDLRAIHAKLDALLGQEGAYLDDLFYCPHHPDGGFEGERAEYKIDCDCRKPKPGLLIQAAERYNVDLSRSYMIGDSTADIAAGKSAGCRTIGVETGAGLSDGKYDVVPDEVCDDLSETINMLLTKASC
jgi:D,D-heptose 1,7-bisphosphate phosphatase